MEYVVQYKFREPTDTIGGCLMVTEILPCIAASLHLKIFFFSEVIVLRDNRVLWGKT